MRRHWMGCGLAAGILFLACSSDDGSNGASFNLDAGIGPGVGVDSGGVGVNEAGVDATTDAPDATADAPTSTIVQATGALSTVDVSTALADLNITENATFDTTSGAITFLSAANGTIRAAGTGVVAGIGFSIVDQGANLPGLAVWTFKSFTVDAAGKVRFSSGSNAVAIAAQGDIAINGLLSVRGDCFATPTTPGPGGFGAQKPSIITGLPDRGGDGSVVTVSPTSTQAVCGGGGGGGGGTAGGGGAFAKRDVTQSTLGTGGGPRAAFLTAPILSGGAGGGDSQGGAGGGAVQLFTQGKITVAGTVEGGGCGGGAGARGTVCVGAGGGGAGGTLFFEATSVAFSDGAKVLANGGAGGGGSSGAGTDANGADGSSTDSTPAVGGSSSSQRGPCPAGQSGNPTAGSTDGECDGNSDSIFVAAPGGAGGQGVIAIKSAGTPTISASAVVNPTAVTGAVTFKP